jgi:hypothetical protein
MTCYETSSLAFIWTLYIKVYLITYDNSIHAQESTSNYLNKSFMNFLNSDKLERLFEGAARMMWFQSLTMMTWNMMTATCWFDSMVFLAFSLHSYTVSNNVPVQIKPYKRKPSPLIRL